MMVSMVAPEELVPPVSLDVLVEPEVLVLLDELEALVSVLVLWPSEQHCSNVWWDVKTRLNLHLISLAHTKY